MLKFVVNTGLLVSFLTINVLLNLKFLSYLLTNAAVVDWCEVSVGLSFSVHNRNRLTDMLSEVVNFGVVKNSSGIFSVDP